MEIDAPAAEAGAADAAPKAAANPRVQVKKWNAVACWSWDVVSDTCAICRNQLYEPSIEAQASELCASACVRVCKARLPGRFRAKPLATCRVRINLRVSLSDVVGAVDCCVCGAASAPPLLPSLNPRLAHPAARVPPDPGRSDDAGYSVAWGVCGHVFHLDCISRWLKTRSVCPLCNREWNFAKIEKIAGYQNVD